MRDGFSSIVRHDSFGSQVPLLQIGQHAIPVSIPLLGYAAHRRVLAAAQLDRDLEAVGEDVVEVLHSAADDVPLGAVGDSAGEVVALADALASVHVLVGGGVGAGEVLEGGVVRGAGGDALQAVAVVVRVVGHHGAVVEVDRKDERVV